MTCELTTQSPVWIFIKMPLKLREWTCCSAVNVSVSRWFLQILFEVLCAYCAALSFTLFFKKSVETDQYYSVIAIFCFLQSILFICKGCFFFYFERPKSSLVLEIIGFHFKLLFCISNANGCGSRWNYFSIQKDENLVTYKKKFLQNCKCTLIVYYR